MLRKMVNSRRKGNKNERNIAKSLESWTGFEMVRTPASGGLRWASGLMVTGDIIPSDPAILASFPFSIEAKVRNDINFRDPLINNSDIEKFYEQSMKDSKRVTKLPLVLFRQDRMAKDLYFVILPYLVFRKIKLCIPGYSQMPFYTFSNLFTIFTSDYLFSAPYQKVVQKLKHINHERVFSDY